MSVTPDDIAVELGRTAPESAATEYAQWEQWIADALFLIGKRLGDVTALDQPTVDYVVRQAVAMHVRRPDDATQVAVSVDDGSVSRTYRSSRGRVEIIDDWWALLSPTDTTGKAFSITPSPSTSPHMPWCDLMFGGATCSCGANLTNYQYPLYEGGVLSGDEY
ncbi:MAG: hypothetical protein ACXWDF_10705 [Aeromicrobium sp.]